ncbi:hypothetical protein ABK040_007724 [Willaertia magna]
MFVRKLPNVFRNKINHKFLNYCNNYNKRYIHDYNKHIFAFHFPELKQILPKTINNKLNNNKLNIFENEIITIDEPSLIKRITNILRLKKGDEFIFFDGTSNFNKFKILSFSKQFIEIQILPLLENKYQNYINFKEKYKITVNICVTKSKEPFEEMLYQCASMGVTEIQPILMDDKKQSNFLSGKEERFEKIMIAACEQSKQFHGLPKFNNPLLFDEVFNNNKKFNNFTKNYFLDVDGNIPFLTSLVELDKLKREHENNGFSLSLLVGPERDLREEERQVLVKKGFEFISLTNQIVYKSEYALTIALGSITSVLWK